MKLLEHSTFFHLFDLTSFHCYFSTKNPNIFITFLRNLPLFLSELTSDQCAACMVFSEHAWMYPDTHAWTHFSLRSQHWRNSRTITELCSVKRKLIVSFFWIRKCNLICVQRFLTQKKSKCVPRCAEVNPKINANTFWAPVTRPWKGFGRESAGRCCHAEFGF